jgi:lysophospholipase L1-like esterase
MVSTSQILPASAPIKFLALGDSYTIGESVAEDQRWPVRLLASLRKKGYSSGEVKIIATTGWRTDDLIKAIDNVKPPKDYDLVSLLIGVNNQYQGKSLEVYTAEFQALLDIATEHAGGDKRKLFVLSIPDYGFTPFGSARQPAITREIDAFNKVNKSLTEKSGISYIDITGISRRGLKDPPLVAEDGLHPSGKMYALWVRKIEAVLIGH